MGRTPKNLSYHIFGGVSVVLPEDKSDSYTDQTIARPLTDGFYKKSAVFEYGARLGFEDSRVSGSIGFAGMMLTEGEIEGFDDRSIHQVEFSGGYRFGKCHTGLSFLLPLDDDLFYERFFRYSFGFKLTVDMSSND